MSIERDIFYFLAYIKGRSEVTVISLGENVRYQRSDWSAVNDLDFHDKDKAIAYGRDFAQRHGLQYVLFECRYYSWENEMLY